LTNQADLECLSCSELKENRDHEIRTDMQIFIMDVMKWINAVDPYFAVSECRHQRQQKIDHIT
jgi:hypothetical protein